MKIFNRHPYLKWADLKTADDARQLKEAIREGLFQSIGQRLANVLITRISIAEREPKYEVLETCFEHGAAKAISPNVAFMTMRNMLRLYSPYFDKVAVKAINDCILDQLGHREILKLLGYRTTMQHDYYGNVLKAAFSKNVFNEISRHDAAGLISHILDSANPNRFSVIGSAFEHGLMDHIHGDELYGIICELVDEDCDSAMAALNTGFQFGLTEHLHLSQLVELFNDLDKSESSLASLVGITAMQKGAIDKIGRGIEELQLTTPRLQNGLEEYLAFRKIHLDNQTKSADLSI